MKEIWPDTFVEEGNLTQMIFILRKALGESEEGKRYIVTMPRLGYRFAATVSHARQEPTTPERSHWLAALPSIRANYWLLRAPLS